MGPMQFAERTLTGGQGGGAPDPVHDVLLGGAEQRVWIVISEDANVAVLKVKSLLQQVLQARHVSETPCAAKCAALRRACAVQIVPHH